MTDRELHGVLQLLDSLWGQVDETLEDGYRLLLADQDAHSVLAAIRQLATDAPDWLPKPPVLLAAVTRLERHRANLQRIDARMRLREQAELASGEVGA